MRSCISQFWRRLSASRLAVPARTVSSARTTFAWAIWGCSRTSAPASWRAWNQCRTAALRRQRPRVGGDDDPDVDATPGCVDEAAQDRPVGEVRVDHVEAALRAGDRVAERRPDRQVTLTRVVEQDLHPNAVAVRDGREEPVELVGGRRQRAALEVPRQQEHRLELGDDRALEAEHEVVRSRRVVILDARAADDSRRGRR